MPTEQPKNKPSGKKDNRYSVGPKRKLVRHAAQVNPDESRLKEIGVLAQNIVHWKPVATFAEKHNMAPLLHHHLGNCGYDINPEGRRMLGALVIRHRHANAALSATCKDILEAYDKAGIGCIVLKGMALSHIIYPDNTLRPMRDIDLLVPASEANRAQSLLADDMGFDITEDHEFARGGGRYMRNHHHLPVASIQRDGLQMSIEVHTDALSGDYPESLSYERVVENSRAFDIHGTPARAMGHVDMLTHLCRHALEPGLEVRLGSVTDIVSYAALFNDEIDWDAVRRERPYVANAIGMLHYISPLPASLGHLIPNQDAPSHPGFSMRPLGAIMSSDSSRSEKMRELMYPPSWWLYAYYGASRGESENLVRLRRHAPRVSRWLGRRAKAAIGA